MKWKRVDAEAILDTDTNVGFRWSNVNRFPTWRGLRHGLHPALALSSITAQCGEALVRSTISARSIQVCARYSSCALVRGDNASPANGRQRFACSRNSVG